MECSCVICGNTMNLDKRDFSVIYRTKSVMFGMRGLCDRIRRLLAGKYDDLLPVVPQY